MRAPTPRSSTRPAGARSASRSTASYRYTYQYIPDPDGQSAMIRATGDLDCDGTAYADVLELRVDGKTVTRTWTHSVTPPPSDD